MKIGCSGLLDESVGRYSFGIILGCSSIRLSKRLIASAISLPTFRTTDMEKGRREGPELQPLLADEAADREMKSRD